MLKLDEKKIRKGKPIGLPYQGSKKIVEIIKQNFGTDRPIYDIFGGGGAITAECVLNGLEVHYNDLDKNITNAFEIAKTNIVIISSYSISDKRFEAVYSFDKARSTLKGGRRNDKCEKLFMVKNS